MAESASVFLPTTNNQPDGGQQPRWVSHVFIAQKFKRHNFAWYEIQMTWNPNYYSLITKNDWQTIAPKDKCIEACGQMPGWTNVRTKIWSRQMSAPRWGPGKCPHQDGPSKCPPDKCPHQDVVQAKYPPGKCLHWNGAQANVHTKAGSRQMFALKWGLGKCRAKMCFRQMSALKWGPGNCPPGKFPHQDRVQANKCLHWDRVQAFGGKCLHQDVVQTNVPQYQVRVC